MGRQVAPILALLTVTVACAVNSRPTLSPDRMAELWLPPTDLERRDLFHGPGGARRAPRPDARYEFVSVKTTGNQPGYEVKDARGQTWSVKQGVESRTEVVVSRLAWALGYHQPYVYHLPEWKLTRDGKNTVESGGRFRLEPPTQKKIGEWSWRNNPFLSTRPMAGLFVLMVMVNNWDLRTPQNSIYEVLEEGGAPRYWYMVRDVGASFGRTSWFAFGTKDDVEAFEQEPFIEAVEGNRVYFHFQGAWRDPQLHSHVTPDDVRWLCQLLTRLSHKQWMDAFRAGGYDEAEASRYIQRMQQKVAEGLTLVRLSESSRTARR